MQTKKSVKKILIMKSSSKKIFNSKKFICLVEKIAQPTDIITTLRGWWGQAYLITHRYVHNCNNPCVKPPMKQIEPQKGLHCVE